MPANLESSVVATGLEEICFHSIPKERQCQRRFKVVLISHASKVILKTLQARLQQYMTKNFHMYKLDLEKVEEPEINCQHHRKSKGIPEKHLFLLH